MFRNIKLTVFVMTVTFFFSCSKLTEQLPFTSVSPKDAFSTPERIEKTSMGMYDALQNAEFFGGRALIYADIRGNDVNAPSYFGNMSTFNVLSNDATVLACWTGGYRTIYEANLFIKNLNLYGNGIISNTLVQRYTAEAKFIRALCYFYLVNLYSRPYVDNVGGNLGVPLILDAAADPLSSVNQVARSTVKQVYDQMIQDLTDAIINLPINYGSVYFNKARATKGAAQALLARVYLYKEDWNNAITMCNNVAAQGYQLAADPYDNWDRAIYTTAVNKERIFSVAMDNTDNPNTNNAIGQHYSADGRGDITISDDYLNLPNFSNTDARKSDSFIRVVDGESYAGKYFDNINDSWVPVLRYAEILLIKAEALAQNNPGAAAADAINILNAIRARSRATPLAPTTQEALLKDIWNERRIELAFEGHGEFDFLRTRREIPARTGHLKQDWMGNFVILPIPLRETQQNPKLKNQQNQGY